MAKEIETKTFGKMTIEDKQILHFPDGVIGFETQNNFAFIEESEDTPFKWLQSLDDIELAFIVIQPILFAPNYKPVLSKEDFEQIGLSKLEETLLLVIVTIPNDNPEMMTANLQGPILINPVTKVGKQFISRDENHPVRKLVIENTETV
jgi:flagellar assembly factor FliW